MLVRFREVPDRPAADLLRDRYLEVEVDSAALPEGSYYWHEVVGAKVATATGETLGTVAEVFRAGESEVFVVGGGPRGEIYVPAVSAVIREFAPREGRIVVDAEALGLDEEVPAPKPRGRRTTRALKQGRPLQAVTKAPPSEGEGSAEAPPSGGEGSADAPATEVPPAEAPSVPDDREAQPEAS
jgi:hypothetical protein